MTAGRRTDVHLLWYPRLHVSNSRGRYLDLGLICTHFFFASSAPELIRGTGYSLSVDYWALGVSIVVPIQLFYFEQGSHLYCSRV